MVRLDRVAVPQFGKWHAQESSSDSQTGISMKFKRVAQRVAAKHEDAPHSHGHDRQQCGSGGDTSASASAVTEPAVVPAGLGMKSAEQNQNQGNRSPSPFKQILRAREEGAVRKGAAGKELKEPVKERRSKGSTWSRFWPFSGFKKLHQQGPAAPAPTPLSKPQAMSDEDAAYVAVPIPAAAAAAASVTAAAAGTIKAAAAASAAADGSTGGLPVVGEPGWNATSEEGAWKPDPGGFQADSGDKEGMTASVVPAIGWWQMADCDDCSVGSSGCFEEVRRTRMGKMKKSTIVVAGSSRGCGSSKDDDVSSTGGFSGGQTWSEGGRGASKAPVPPIGWWEGEDVDKGGSSEELEHAREKKASRRLCPCPEQGVVA